MTPELIILIIVAALLIIVLIKLFTSSYYKMQTAQQIQTEKVNKILPIITKDLQEETDEQ